MIVFLVEDLEKLEDWIIFWFKIWKGEFVIFEGVDVLRFMKMYIEGLIGIFRDIVEWMLEGSFCWINEMRYWFVELWDNCGGCVILFGDVVYLMLICEFLFYLMLMSL